MKSEYFDVMINKLAAKHAIMTRDVGWPVGTVPRREVIGPTSASCETARPVGVRPGSGIFGRGLSNNAGSFFKTIAVEQDDSGGNIGAPFS
jgi:hypothetical protein